MTDVLNRIVMWLCGHWTGHRESMVEIIPPGIVRLRCRRCLYVSPGVNLSTSN